MGREAGDRTGPGENDGRGGESESGLPDDVMVVNLLVVHAPH